MELFAKTINRFKPLTIFAKVTILNAWQGSEYASTNTFKVKSLYKKDQHFFHKISVQN